MAKRSFRPEDGLRLMTATDPDLSPDGRRAAFVVAAPTSSGPAVLVDLGRGARRLRAGAPVHRRTRGQEPTVVAGRPLARVHLDRRRARARARAARAARRRRADAPRRPAGSGQPARVVAGLEADRRRVPRRGSRSREGERKRAQRAARRARDRGAPRRRRLAGRPAPLFLVDVEGGSAGQLTRGDYDHDDPSFSPDGATVVFASDRHPRRDDRQFRNDAWVVPTGGGRPRRLTNGKGRAAFPVFSPDGKTVAFAGGKRRVGCGQPRVRRPRRRRRRGRAGRAGPRSPGRPVPRPSRTGVLDRRTRAADARRRPRRGQVASGAARRAAEPRDRRRRHHHRRRRRRDPAGARSCTRPHGPTARASCSRPPPPAPSRRR